LETKKIVAIGKYAEKMAKNSISTSDYNHIEVKVIPHPSPANPIANKDKGRIWREIVKEILTK